MLMVTVITRISRMRGILCITHIDRAMKQVGKINLIIQAAAIAGKKINLSVFICGQIKITSQSFYQLLLLSSIFRCNPTLTYCVGFVHLH